MTVNGPPENRWPALPSTMLLTTNPGQVCCLLYISCTNAATPMLLFWNCYITRVCPCRVYDGHEIAVHCQKNALNKADSRRVLASQQDATRTWHLSIWNFFGMLFRCHLKTHNLSAQHWPFLASKHLQSCCQTPSLCPQGIPNTYVLLTIKPALLKHTATCCSEELHWHAALQSNAYNFACVHTLEWVCDVPTSHLRLPSWWVKPLSPVLQGSTEHPNKEQRQAWWCSQQFGTVSQSVIWLSIAKGGCMAKVLVHNIRA